MLHPISKTVNVKGVILFIFLTSYMLVGCRTQEVQTYWSSAPVKVDGKMDDWANAPMLYFEDSGVQLGLRNDSENLYILFRFNNEAWARAIRMGGLTLWLDNSGKKKKDLGIRYIGGPFFDDFQRMESSTGGGFEETLTPEQKQRLLDKEKIIADQTTIIDKKNNREMTLPANDTDGPAVCFDSSQGAYTYEFSIPLQKSDSTEFGIGAQPGQAICLGLEWGGMSKADRASRERMGGSPPGGMGGGRGERPGGGSRPQASEKQELWIKTKLALASAE